MALHKFFHSMSRWAKWALLGVFVAPILSNPMFDYTGRDSGIFLYIGSLVLKGKIPYLAAWENKGPLVFYIDALGIFLGNGSRWGVWLMEFLFLFAGIVLSYKILRQLMGEIPAWVGSFIWISVAGNVLSGGNYTEEYSLLFAFVAAFGFLKSLEQPLSIGHLLLIGVSLGLNILLRPNNISMQVAVLGAYFVLAVLSGEWRLLFKRMIWIFLSSSLVILLAGFYFYMQGALSDMIDAVLIFNYQYSDNPTLPKVLTGIEIASTTIGIIFIVLAVMGYIFSLFSLLKREALNTVLGRFLIVLIIGWPLETLLSTLSGRNYIHYFILWAPYVGLLGGYAVYVLLRFLSNRLVSNPEKYTSYIVAVLLLISVIGNMDAWKKYGNALAGVLSSPQAELDYRHPVASYIEANTSPGDKVLVWGFRPVINFMAGRESPATYLPYPLSHVESGLTHQWAEEFYQQITSEPPIMIVDMVEPPDRERIPFITPELREKQRIKRRQIVLAPNLDIVLNFIEQNYVLVEEVDGYRVYSLKTDMP
ncbi:MAG: glycosyltransferase family 39 protein [Anaerolineae bacterium]|nr:glycosyltransferase family 39 protein [Anaerolineae bacterium]